MRAPSPVEHTGRIAEGRVTCGLTAPSDVPFKPDAYTRAALTVIAYATRVRLTPAPIAKIIAIFPVVTRITPAPTLTADTTDTSGAAADTTDTLIIFVGGFVVVA